MNTPTDAECVLRTRRGDREAFSILVQRYWGKVYRRIRAKVAHSEDARDLTQETLIAAYLKLHQLVCPERFPHWLGRIADNTARMWLRRQVVQLSWEDHPELHPAHISRSPEERYSQWKVAQLIRKAVRSLPEAQRQAVTHHYLEGYTYRETAMLLRIDVDAVRSRLGRARRTLRKDLAMGEERARELSRKDLQALIRAGAFVSQDPDRPPLQRIFLDRNGAIVATDGHRLILRHSEVLKGISPVSVTPFEGLTADELPESGRLSIGDDQAQLELSDGRTLTASVSQEEYVDYPKVIPTTWICRATLSGEELLQSLSEIQEHLAPRHPIDLEGVWRYVEAVELRISAVEETISVRTSREIGYSRKEETDPEAPLPSGTAPVPWEFVIPLPADVTLENGEEIFRAGFNAKYLRGVVEALDLEHEEKLILFFTGPTSAMMGYPSNGEDRKILLMPLRLLAREETGDRRQEAGGASDD